MMENTCYTYFRIVGDFEPNEITAILGLEPHKMWKMGDMRPNGTTYTFSSCEFGFCDVYDVLTECQMHQTIAPLFDKVDVLCRIKDMYDVSFFLEVVPTVYADQPAPCLAPSMQVIDFCHATRTQLEIDLYVMEQEK